MAKVTTCKRPTDPYDVEGWKAYHAANPGMHRSVGADGAGDGAGDGGGDGGSDGGDGGGGNGGGSGEIDTNSEVFRTALATAVEAAVQGLKGTNASLKNEKTELKNQLTAIMSKLDGVGGVDQLEGLNELRQKLEQDEMLQLLKDGKHEEYIDRRTEGMRRSHQTELEARDGKIATLEGTAQSAVRKLHETLLDVDVRSAATKVNGFDATATDDALLWAKNLFEYSEEHNCPVMYEGAGEDRQLVYGKDGKSPKSVTEWLEEQRETKRHWFGASKGSGAGGSAFVDSDGKSDYSRVANMSMDEYRAARESGKLK